MNDEYVTGFIEAFNKVKNLLVAAREDAFDNANLSNEQHEAVNAQLESLIMILEDELTELEGK